MGESYMTLNESEESFALVKVIMHGVTSHVNSLNFIVIAMESLGYCYGLKWNMPVTVLHFSIPIGVWE